MAILLAITLSLGQVSDPMKGFTTSLANPIYQEKAWVNYPYEKRDQSGKAEYDAVLKRWKGRRYDMTLLKPYEKDFKAKPNFQTAFTQANAVIGFSGIEEGYTATYWLTGYKERQFGREQYWALAKYWPKSPSIYHLRTRAILCMLIRANIERRIEGLKRLTVFFPLDSMLKRLEIVSLHTLRSSYGPKLTIDELKSDFKVLQTMYKTDSNTGSLSACYGVGYRLAELTGDKRDYVTVVAYGEELVKRYKLNAIDSRVIPQIQSAIDKAKQKSN